MDFRKITWIYRQNVQLAINDRHFAPKVITDKLHWFCTDCKILTKFIPLYFHSPKNNNIEFLLGHTIIETLRVSKVSDNIIHGLNRSISTMINVIGKQYEAACYYAPSEIRPWSLQADVNMPWKSFFWRTHRPTAFPRQ